MGNRMERLKEYAAERGPKGEAASKANLTYWSERASRNSYHGKDDGKAPPSEGRTDKNDLGSSFEPKVRRAP